MGCDAPFDTFQERIYRVASGDFAVDETDDIRSRPFPSRRHRVPSRR